MRKNITSLIGGYNSLKRFISQTLALIMNRIFFLIIFLLNLSCSCQNYEIKKLTGTNPSYNNQSYEFPLLSGPNKAVCDKINSLLISDILDIEMGKEKESLFENVWSTEANKIPRLSYLKYKIEILNPKICSVSFFGEGCGAYCEEFTETYTFLLKNGEQIKLENILNESGQKKLLEEIINHKKELLEKSIMQVKTEMQNDNVSESDLEAFRMEIVLYENCFLNYQTLEYFRFVPSDKVIDIYIERCANHAQRALDNLGVTKYQLIISEWENEFTELGKKLINN